MLGKVEAWAGLIITIKSYHNCFFARYASVYRKTNTAEGGAN